MQSHLISNLILAKMLGGHKQNLVSPEPRERKGDSHSKLSQPCLWVFEGLLQRHGSAVACLGDRAAAILGDVACGLSLLRGGRH